MPRRREVPKRETLPDPVFGSTLISKFISCMMIQGKKSVAEGAFYGSLEIVKDRAKEDPVKVFKKAMENVKPILEVKSRRVGGATYQVPIEVPQDRRTSLAIRWIISNARSRGEKTMREKLAAEISAKKAEVEVLEKSKKGKKFSLINLIRPILIKTKKNSWSSPEI